MWTLPGAVGRKGACDLTGGFALRNWTVCPGHRSAHRHIGGSGDPSQHAVGRDGDSGGSGNGPGQSPVRKAGDHQLAVCGHAASVLHWMLIAARVGILAVAPVLAVNSPYLNWDYSAPETAVMGVAIHAFEWGFIRLAPFAAGGGKVVCGMYGINLDESMGGDEFEYLIADNYDPAKEIPDGFTTRSIPAHTWAVFPCTGKMPQALQGLNQQIFSQWLPTNPDYKIAAGINVELYSDASRFEQGTQDQEYYCEVWLPVEKK